MSNPHNPKGATLDGTKPAHGLNEDGMNIFKIVVVGVVSLVIFAVSAVVAALILSNDEAQLNVKGLAPIPADIYKKEELGIIDVVPFDNDLRLENWHATKTKALSTYSWVDRGKGVVRMPIEAAMKEVIQKAATEGGAK